MCFPVISKWTFSVLFYLLLLGDLQSQNTLPLKQLLDTLEQRYEIVFSYANTSIEDVFLVPPKRSLNLSQCIDYLTEATPLVFEQLSDRFVTIRTRPVDSTKICGYLIDSSSGEPVISAIISSSNQFAISEQEGYFELIVPENQQVTVSHIGYYNRIIPSDGREPCLTIQLLPKISELQSIYVSNYLAKGISKIIYGDVQVKTHELQVLPGLSEPDVLYTMQVLPGIQSPNESVSDINIRGGTNDQNLILFDGIKMYQTGHFYGLISAFNPYFTNTVTLTKNGSSARLGDGVSGTLDIQSDQSVADSLSGGIGINLVSANMNLEIPLSEKASISLSARRSIADLIQTPTYDNYYDRAFQNSQVIDPNTSDSIFNSVPDFQFHDLSANVIFQLSERDQLKFSFLKFYNNLNYNQNAVIDDVEESRASELTQGSIASGLNYSRRWNASFLTEVNTYLSSYKIRAVNNDILNNQRLLQENGVLEFAVKVHGSYIINPRLDMQGGLQFVETGVSNLEELNNPDFRRLIKDVIRNQSAYLEANYNSLSHKSNLRFGLRANYYDPLQTFLLEPRLSFHQKLLPNLSLEVLGEFKNQTTTQIIDLQNDFLGVEKRRWVISDEETIPIIQSKQASIGLHYEHNEFLITFEGYAKIVDGIITSSQSFQNQFEFLRADGNYRIKGFDFLMNKNFNHFSGWASYALAKNEFEFAQLITSSFPNNLDVLHNLTLGSSYVGDHLELSTSINWHSGRPYTPTNDFNPIAAGIISYQSPNSGRLMDYLRVDFSGKYRLRVSNDINAVFGFSIWNLTGYRNILNTYYRMDDVGTIKEIQEKGLDFTPNAFLRFQF